MMTRKVTLTKIHKVTLYIVDHDGVGANGVREVIENVNYPNDCIAPEVAHVETREVEWRDDHPLNMRATSSDAFEELFES